MSAGSLLGSIIYAVGRGLLSLRSALKKQGGALNTRGVAGASGTLGVRQGQRHWRERWHKRGL